MCSFATARCVWRSHHDRSSPQLSLSPSCDLALCCNQCTHGNNIPAVQPRHGMFAGRGPWPPWGEPVLKTCTEPWPRSASLAALLYPFDRIFPGPGCGGDPARSANTHGIGQPLVPRHLQDKTGPGLVGSLILDGPTGRNANLAYPCANVKLPRWSASMVGPPASHTPERHMQS